MNDELQSSRSPAKGRGRLPAALRRPPALRQFIIHHSSFLVTRVFSLPFTGLTLGGVRSLRRLAFVGAAGDGTGSRAGGSTVRRGFAVALRFSSCLFRLSSSSVADALSFADA